MRTLHKITRDEIHHSLDIIELMYIINNKNVECIIGVSICNVWYRHYKILLTGEDLNKIYIS